MKYLMWLLKAAIFFVLFAFALNNQDTVTLHWFFGASSRAPMVLVLLLTLLLGVALGVLVMLPLWWRARRTRTPSETSQTEVPLPAETLPAPAQVPLSAPDVEPPQPSKVPSHGL